MKVIHSVHPDDFKAYNTALIRERFLVEDLMQADQINFTYTHYDRMMVGGAMPVKETLPLTSYPNLRARLFFRAKRNGHHQCRRRRLWLQRMERTIR